MNGTFVLSARFNGNIEKVIVDLVGERNFVNEIIWRRQTAHSDRKQGAKHYDRLHDTILFYVKSAPANYTWNTQFTPYEQEYINRSYDGTDPNGRKFMLSDTAGPGGAAKGNPKYEFLGVTRYWRYSKEKMEELYKQGRIVQTKPGNVPRYKRYLDEMKGVELQDIWIDIKPVGASREDLGYPTQKPELLLERIIKTSSNPMDIVFDPFCGCGTATAVAHRLGRRWIGIDISPTACELMRKRMISLGARHFVVMGMPMTEKELRKIDHFEFQNWVIQ